MHPSPPPAAAARRRYRRRRPGQPVSPEWLTGVPQPPVTNPLSGVLGETWQQYRRHAARLIPVAAGGYLVVSVAIWLVYAVASRFDGRVALLLALPAIWLLTKLATFIVQAVTASVVTEARTGAVMPVSQAVRTYLGEITTAWLVVTPALLAGLALLVIPGLYLITVWAVCVPVIVIERAGPLASLRRSRQLIRGHGDRVFGRLLMIALINSALFDVFRLAFSWLPTAWQGVVSITAANILVGPFAAVAVTLMYYRLAAAEQAEVAVTSMIAKG